MTPERAAQLRGFAALGCWIAIVLCVVILLWAVLINLLLGKLFYAAVSAGLLFCIAVGAFTWLEDL